LPGPKHENKGLWGCERKTKVKKMPNKSERGGRKTFFLGGSKKMWPWQGVAKDNGLTGKGQQGVQRRKGNNPKRKEERVPN